MSHSDPLTRMYCYDWMLEKDRANYWRELAIMTWIVQVVLISVCGWFFL